MSEQMNDNWNDASPAIEGRPHDRDRLLELACGYLDGTATAGDVAALEALLAATPGARRDFLAFSLIHCQLAFPADGRSAVVPSVDDRPRASSAIGGRRGWWPFGRAAAVLVALAVAGVAAGLYRGLVVGPALATVTEARLVVPAGGAAALAEGETLSAGRITIDSGAIKLVLRNGVTVLLNGPADVDLVDEMHFTLYDGTVAVRVPKGMSGFRVKTVAAEVLDLGTEFAVRATGGLITDVQVYEGVVVASGRSGTGAGVKGHRIEAGEAMRFRIDPVADPEQLPFVESRFLRAMPPEPAVGEPFMAESLDIAHFGTPTHREIQVLSFDEPPTIDGRLDEWPAQAGFRAFFLNDPQSAEWVEGRMAYDSECLYIAARVGDPAPLRNHVDPILDPDKGYVGGGIQVRISTDRAAGWPVAGNSYGYYWRRGRFKVLPSVLEKAAATNAKLCHLMMWHHAPTGRACLSISHGMTYTVHEGNPPGYRGAFAAAPDGKGYVLEYAIPWALLNAADDPPQRGDVLATSWQVHFADHAGKVWRRQIIDVRNLDEPYRIGVWQRAATWGRAEFR